MKISQAVTMILIATAPLLHARNNNPFLKNEPAKQELFLDPTKEQVESAIPARNLHCPVDGIALGEKPQNSQVIYKGNLVVLDCAACKPEFARNPAKYLEIAKADTLKSAH